MRFLNMPVFTGTPFLLISSTNSSYSFRAAVSSIALEKLGRLPFFILDASVNCETTRNSPATSRIDKFILLNSSSKILRLITLFARYFEISLVSPFSTPRSTKSPRLISETISLSTVTAAFFTLCNTIFM